MRNRCRWRFALTLATTIVVLLAPGRADAQARVFSADSVVSVVLPGTFHPIGINPNAVLQFVDTASQSYAMVLWESREDLVGWNLTRHSMITIASILTGVDYPELVGPTATTIGGNPAVQYEIHGALQGTKISYLHTSVETPTAFAQVLVWSIASQWDAKQEDLRAIAGSLEVASSIPAISMDVHDIVEGTWAWESRDQPCSSDTQTFVVADDRQTMQIHHSEPITNSAGETRTVTDYVIEGTGPLLLHTYIPDETRLTDTGEPVKWDLVVIGRNRIAWHRADWPEGSYTGMLRRCG